MRSFPALLLTLTLLLQNGKSLSSNHAFVGRSLLPVHRRRCANALEHATTATMTTFSNSLQHRQLSLSHQTCLRVSQSTDVTATERTNDLSKIKTGLVRRAWMAFCQAWRSVRRFVRKQTQGYTVYILECEHNKYYVGSTTDRRRRFQEHQSDGGGSKWTSLYKPIRVMRLYKRIPASYYLGMEAKVTAETMLQYGVNNVRGAMFAEPRNYTIEDIRALTGFLGHYNDLNYNDVSFRLERELGDYHVRTRTSKRNRRRTAKQKANDKCFHCGKRGHWANECPEVWGTLNDAV